MLQAINRIVEWLKENLPNLLLAFGVGFKQGEKGKLEVEKNLLDEETARKKAENVATVLKNNDGKSDVDIIKSIIRGKQ